MKGEDPNPFFLSFSHFKLCKEYGLLNATDNNGPRLLGYGGMTKLETLLCRGCFMYHSKLVNYEKELGKCQS